MITTLVLRVVERVHGHFGWLAVAALVHPAILLRDPRRRARLAATLAAVTVVLAAGIGAWVYPHYRLLLKQRIFVESARVGWLFERKEHLSVGAVAFALIGCVAHLVVPAIDDAPTRLRLARLAHRAFVIGAALAFVVAVLGVTVASFRSF